MATMKNAPKCGNCHGLWCEECNECHACGPDGVKVDATPQKSTGPLSATTQKAKGVLALQNYNSFGNIPKVWGIIREEAAIDAWRDDLFPLFARPCPKRPRHGFVDSRVVQTKDELKTVLAETLAADPEGEMMVMQPLLDAKWSAVLTPSLLTIGPSNDGATAGKDTVTIPIRPKPLEPALLKAGEIGEEEDPYLEFVQQQNALYVTQLRAGPRVEGNGINYIPADVVVKEIINPENGPDYAPYSLLDWEKKMESVKGQEGVVVSHPGGSMTDHYSVHARLNRIPIITALQGVLCGQILKKETDDSIPFSPEAVMRGIVIGEKISLPLDFSVNAQPLQPYVALLLMALYNSPSMVGEYGRWLGIAASLMLRLGSTALSGEARHAKRKDGKGMPDREKVYSHVLPFSLSRHRARLNRLINVLRYGFEGGGIGGEKWAKCGASLIPLFNGVSELARNPSEEGVRAIAKALNVAVDQAHNNGWWLNKFADQSLFESIQAGKIRHLLKSGDAIMAAKAVTLSEAEIVTRQVKYAGWEPIIFRPVRMNKAILSSLPNLPGLSFNVYTRLLKGSRTINIPAKAITESVIPLLGQFFLLSGEHGLRVEMRMKNGEKVKVWEEKALL